MKKTVLINSQFFSLTLISFVLLFTTSCKNFLNGEDLISSLEETIRYNNASYVSVEIKADIDVTKELNPAAGKYADKYKAGDSFEISFVPASKYQFIGWKVTPEGSVSLVDTKAATTIVTIESDKNPIVIEPVLCEKPTVSFLPKNAVSVEKNTPIIITFSKPMDITQEDIERIQINTIASSVLEYFPNPTLSEDKTTITYTADDTKLLSFEGDVQNVTIVVPQDFYYLYDGEKIMMENEVSYTYMVNQQTSIKLSLTVSNPNPNAGTCNLDGEYFFSIGAIQNLNIPVLQDYAFSKWIVTDLEGQEILPSIYEQFFVFENIYSESTNITVKKIGSGFCISPVCIKRAHVVASTPAYESMGVNRSTNIRVLFDQKMSVHSIYWTQAELDKIRKTDNISIENFNYEDFEVANILSEKNEKFYYAYQEKTDLETKKYFKNIEIKIRDSDPEISLVNGDYFGCPYFETESILVIPTKESFDILPEFSDIEFIITKDFMNEAGGTLASSYSACYKTNGLYDFKAPTFTFKYKGNYPGGDNDFETSDYLFTNVIGIQPYKYEDKDEEISKSGIWYITFTETEPHAHEDDGITEYNNSILNKIKSAGKVDELNSIGIKDTKSVTIDGLITVTDPSGVSAITLNLTPVKNNIYKNQSDKVYTVTYDCLGKTELTFGNDPETAPNGTNPNLSYDLSLLPIEGVYKLSITISDVVGNKTEDIPFRSFIRCKGKDTFYPNNDYDYYSESADNSYCIVDNIFDANFSFTAYRQSNPYYYDISGSVGRYGLTIAKPFITYSELQKAWNDDTENYSGYEHPRTVKQEISNEGDIIDSLYYNVTPLDLVYCIAEDLFGNLTYKKFGDNKDCCAQ